MKTNIIIVDDIYWEDDENPIHGGTIEFSIEDYKYMATYEGIEDIRSKWIQADMYVSNSKDLTLEEVLTLNTNKEKRIYPGLVRSGKYMQNGYICYGQIVSIDPLLLDCGNLILDIENSLVQVAHLTQKGYLGKYIYYEITQLLILRYRILQ